MTDILNAPKWHTTAEEETTELRRRLADAELRAMNAIAAEDVAQFAFETAKRRADTLETVLRSVLVEFVIEPITGEAPESVLDSIVDGLLDDLDSGLAVDELPEVARRLLNGAEER
jgi:phage tail sheath protein FI